jgi:hypothetical protein
LGVHGIVPDTRTQNLSGRTFMLKITLSLDARQKLATLLAKDEDFDQPYLRIRSVVAGGG